VTACWKTGHKPKNNTRLLACGIVGAVAQRNVVPILVEGLKRLEYRGYDSAGIAVLGNGGAERLDRVRAVGKVKALEDAIRQLKTGGQTGIAHTRWATHGVPSETTPTCVSHGVIAVVHNGI
jgi:glucosamine--fructose-6-phosphate aminotransferase (isomerizing)